MNNEFAARWAKLSKRDRRNVHRSMRLKAIEGLSTSMKFHCTGPQLRAAGKKKVDIAISILRCGVDA